MGGKVKGERLLISLSREEKREIAKAAKLESLPVATFIRREAVFSARAKLKAAEP